MRLILIRHAQSLANAQGRWQGTMDFDLSVDGISQSQKLHERLMGEELRPSHIYSSPLTRAYKTAEISLPQRVIHKISDLRENDAGVFSGKTSEELSSEYAVIYEEFRRSRNFDLVPEAETRYQIRRRAETVVAFLIKGHNSKDFVIGYSHSGFLVHLISVILGTNRVWNMRIPNTAIFDFEIDTDNWDVSSSMTSGVKNFQINRFADDSHLR
ncbi:histidine phosphatase family protein [Chloroflexi bacterium]|nr:histidine phosphatase family protein [Chloroflexota bacterium]